MGFAQIANKIRLNRETDMKISESKLAPSIFLGHGSPLNAIADNNFTKSLLEQGELLGNVKGIIVISAHWITSGVQLTSHQINPLIYDFYGFPDELYKIKFETKGNPQISNDILQTLSNHDASVTEKWGLDHGAWTVLMHMFPHSTSIPIFQLSLNKNWNLKEHFEFARTLMDLRKKGFAIIGSGNIVHNLRQISWEETAPTPAWALEFDQFVTENLNNRQYGALLEPKESQTKMWMQAHPSIDHYLPLIYTIGASSDSESMKYPFVGFQNGSISMRSVQFG